MLGGASSQNHTATPRFVIAIAASAGGVAAISKVLSELPPNLPAAVLILLHLHPQHKSRLPEILSKRTKLRVQVAQAGDSLREGTVYVAPPDRHLVVRDHDRLDLTTEAKVNFTRPAADPLFASVAQHYRGRTILVVLTGYGRNGSACLPFAKELGATIIAQDEATSAHFQMPQAAIDTGAVDEVLPLEEIGPRLHDLTQDHLAPT